MKIRIMKVGGQSYVNLASAKLILAKMAVKIKEVEDEFEFTTNEGKAIVKYLDNEDAFEMFFGTYGDMEPEVDIALEVVHIEAKNKGKGVGTALMEKIIAFAKKKKVEGIYLNASPVGAFDKEGALEHLLKFYGKFGFKVLKKYSDNALMFLKI